MYKKDSDYALNKRSSNIVYRLADGSAVEIKPEDCSDFERWKALSDADYHEQELADRRISRNDLSMNESILGNVESLFEDESEDLHTLENAMAILEQCLTKTQMRRYLLYVFDGKATRQIAQIEGVSQRAVMVSLHESSRKIKIFLQNTFSNRQKNGDR